jgi:hypothetical protein
MSGCIWDSGNKSASISLGRQSVVAYTNAANGTWKGVRATTSQSNGKLYLEFVPGYIGNNGFLVGFGNSSYSTATQVGSNSNSFGFQSQGSTYTIAGGWQAMSKMGEVVQVAIDLTNKLVWARTDRSTNWNNSGTADPATGVGGKSYSTTGALFPVVSLFDGSGLNFCYINAGAFPFVGTLPSGFSAWDSTAITGTGIGGTHGPTTWDGVTKNANIALSGGNLVATQNSASSTWCDVRSTSSMNSGGVYFEFTETGQPAGPAGHVIGIACDFNRGIMWCKDITAAGNWNGDAVADPATGKRGAAIPPGDMFIFFGGFRNGGNSDAVTLNTGATAFTGTLPTGYLAWDNSTGVVQGTQQTAVTIICG